MLIGGNALGILMAEANAPLWQRLSVLLVAIILMLWAERVLPYEAIWNRDHGDTLRDVLHGSINTALNYAGIWLLPLFGSLGIFAGYWPSGWPFWLQVVFAILILDTGITLTHYASHKASFLWRFHAVHHSVGRMYGFNGLMKHPIHQAIETIGGIAPLLLLGIPTSVATGVVFAVAIQLLLQHSNVDYRTGPFKYVFAIAEIHRFHHRKGAGLGDVNFGLFTTIWDHLLRTFYYTPDRVGMDELGIGDQPNYPQRYFPQLIEPFRPSRRPSTAYRQTEEQQ
jgi:sterol desaturase/sphingolipid hydroxylase (fatty acid hydroxylase superfamily)